MNNKNLFLSIALLALSLAGATQAAPVVIDHVRPLEHLTALNPDTGYCYAGAPLAVCGAESHKPVLANASFAQLSTPSDEEHALAKQAELAAKRARQADAAAAPVPEPTTFAMMLIGLILLGFNSSRREAFDKFSA